MFQVGDDEPMESPPLAPGHQPYPRVDPKQLVGIDTISTRAGTFRARHYRDRTGYGEQVDYWIDDSVGPIGLIRLEAEQKQHPTIRAGFKFELVATGNDAVAQHHQTGAAVRRVGAEEARAAVDAADARRAAAAGQGGPMTHVGRHGRGRAASTIARRLIEAYTCTRYPHAPCQRASTLALVLAAACAAPVQQQAERETAGRRRSGDRDGGDGAADCRDGGRDLAAAHAVRGKLRGGAAGQVGGLRRVVPRRGDDQRARRAGRAKGSEAVTLETTTETRPGDRTVFATVFAATRDAGWRRDQQRVSGRATTIRWSRRRSGPRSSRTRASTRSKLVGTDMISVRAGPFRAKHYRYRTPYGEQVDFWIDDSVAPIGLIKLEAEQKQHSAFRAGFKFELVATGSGAIPQVTTPGAPVRRAACCSGRGCPGRGRRASGRSRP